MCGGILMKIDAYNFEAKKFRIKCDCEHTFLTSGLPNKIQCPLCGVITYGKWLLKTFTKRPSK